jgi:hypothetical protein
MEKTYIIYKIECKTTLEDGYVYVGSTSAFRKRKYGHKSMCCNETGKLFNLKVYKLIRENGGWDNWEMKPIEELRATKTQAHIREQYWIDHFKPALNTINATLNPQYHKIYYEAHQEDHNKRMKEYYHNNKKETKTIRDQRMKEYRELHRDELNKKQNEKYHQKKNEKMNAINYKVDTKEIN